MSDFSLFRGDPLNRLLAKLGIGSEHPISLAARFALLILVTAAPTAFFCISDGFALGRPRALNFFGDIAAFGQAFLGYPLFILAEIIIGKKTEETAEHFLNGNLISDADRAELQLLHQKVKSLAQRVMPDIICLVLGLLFALMWINEEMHNGYETWHAVGPAGAQWPTRAGWWVALIGIPVFNYWWLRFIWKIDLWCWYLFKVSRFRLSLLASHPDMTGGLNFLSQTQGSFAVVVFAFGIGIIAPLIGYKLEIEGSALESYAVAAPLISFMLGAPLFFSLPLLFFTQQLAHVKKAALRQFQDRAREVSEAFEKSWLYSDLKLSEDRASNPHLSAVNNLHTTFNNLKGMRVVPFDVRSFTQLLASTMGSLLPIVPKVLTVSPTAMKVLDLVKDVLGKL